MRDVIDRDEELLAFALFLGVQRCDRGLERFVDVAVERINLQVDDLDLVGDELDSRDLLGR